MCNADTFFTSVQTNVKGLEATAVDRSMTRRRSGFFHGRVTALSGDIGYRCVLDSTRGFVGVGSTLFPCKAVKISMTSLDFRIPHHNGIARTYQAPVDTDIHAIPLPEGRYP